MGGARYQRTMSAVMDDEGLTGNLLLVAAAITHLLAQGTDSPTFRDVARITGLEPIIIKIAIGRDAPRYEPPLEPDVDHCAGTHETGRQCLRRRGSLTRIGIVDPPTGAVEVVLACSKHRDELYRAMRTASQRWLELGKPRPPANTGGALVRAFPGRSWDSTYRWARPGWEPPVDVELPSARPRLVLLQGGA